MSIDNCIKNKQRKTHLSENLQKQPIRKDLHIAVSNEISEYSAEYFKVMNDITPYQISPFDLELNDKEINYHPTWMCPILCTQKIKYIPIPDVYSLKVHLSYFTFKLKIFCKKSNSQLHYYMNKIGKGSYGSIYQFSDNEVIKTVSLINKKQDDKKMLVKNTLQQYCIMKLASVLKIGPKLTATFGFDLIFYQDCIQFTMQKCKPPLSYDKKDMLIQLKTLHSLHLSHGDIKPENVMYSQVYKKNVLIDYNCSTVISQKVGNTTFTNFRGTYQYCHKSMRQLIIKKKEGYVDLYYNDLFCLLKTMQDNYEFPNKIISYNKSIENEQIDNFHWHLQLRGLIYLNEYSIMKQFLNQNKSRLFPSLALTKKIKIREPDIDRQQLQYYHQIYGNIVQNTRDTINFYENFRYFKAHSKTLQLLQSVFDRHIFNSRQLYFGSQLFKNNIQSYPPLLTFDNYIYKDYIYQQNYCLEQNNIFKSINYPQFWQHRYKSSYLVKKMSDLSVTKNQIKKYYYQLLQSTPSDDQLLISLKLIKQKFNFNFKNFGKSCLLQNLLTVDKIFKAGKEKKAKIWKKLCQLEIKQNKSFIQRLIYKICQVIQIQSTPVFLSDFLSDSYYFLRLKYMMQLQKQLLEVNYLEKSDTIIQKVLYWLVRILRKPQRSYEQFKKFKNNYIKLFIKLQSLYNKFGNQDNHFVDLINLVQQILHYQQKSQICSKNRTHTYNLGVISDYKHYAKYKYLSQVQNQYGSKININTNVLVQLINKIKKIVSSEIIQLIQIIQISPLHKIHNSIQQNQIQNIKEVNLIWVGILQNYYCSIDLQECSTPFIRNLVCLINKTYVLIYQRAVTAKQKQLNALMIFQNWVRKNIKAGYQIFQCFCLLFDLYSINGHFKQNIGFLAQALSYLDHYQILNSDNLSEYMNLLCRKLKANLCFDGFIGKIVQVDILIDRIIYNQWIYSNQSNLILCKYILSQKQYDKFFGFLKSQAEYYEQNFQKIPWYISQVLCAYQLRIIIEQIQISVSFLQYYNNFIRQIRINKNYAPIFCFKVLIEMLSILIVRKNYIEKFIQQISQNVLQKSLSYILQSIQYCPLAIQLVCKRKLIQIIRKIFYFFNDTQNLADAFRIQQIFPNNKFLKISLFWINLKCLRNSYISNKIAKRTLLIKTKKNKTVYRLIEERIQYMKKLLNMKQKELFILFNKKQMILTKNI